MEVRTVELLSTKIGEIPGDIAICQNNTVYIYSENYYKNGMESDVYEM